MLKYALWAEEYGINCATSWFHISISPVYNHNQNLYVPQYTLYTKPYTTNTQWEIERCSQMVEKLGQTKILQGWKSKDSCKCIVFQSVQRNIAMFWRNCTFWDTGEGDCKKKIAMSQSQLKLAFNVSFQYLPRANVVFSRFFFNYPNENHESFTNSPTCCNIATPDFSQHEKVENFLSFCCNSQLIIYCQAKSLLHSPLLRDLSFSRWYIFFDIYGKCPPPNVTSISSRRPPDKFLQSLSNGLSPLHIRLQRNRRDAEQILFS